MSFAYRLELKNVERVALLRVVDSLDEPVVALLEGIHLNGTLLLKSEVTDLLLAHFGLFRVIFGLFENFSVFPLGSLNGSDKLLLLCQLVGLGLLGNGLLILLLLFHLDGEAEIVVKLLFGLGDVG